MKETKFKQTEVGMIPSDWEVKKIGELCSITTGSQNTQDHKEDGKYPFFVRSQEVERIDKYIFDTEGVVTAGDGVGTGKIFHYVNGKFGLHQRCYLMYEFDRNISAKYFYWIFSVNFYDRVHSMTAKSSVDSVRREMIADMPIAFPPIKEQQRIANALSDVDTLIANLEKLIAKKKNIKQGAMQQLLTGKKRLPGFAPAKPTYKQTELGKIPTDWEVKHLKKIGVFSKGAGISRDESNSGNIPAVRYGEIYTKHNDYIKKFYSHISQDVADKSVKMQKGDLLFSASGETKEDIGKTIAFVDDFDAYAGGDIIIFTPTETIDSIYMGYLLNFPSIAKQKAMKAQGDAVVHITTDSLKKLAVCLPSPQEQTAIANVLSDMDTEIATLETKLAKYRKLKTGMMQQLLTGKIRLV